MIFYHATLRRKAPSILKQGLMPDVFLAQTPESALDQALGNPAREDDNIPASEYVVLAITGLTREDIEMLDDPYHWIVDTDLYHESHIPPSNIKVHWSAQTKTGKGRRSRRK